MFTIRDKKLQPLEFDKTPKSLYKFRSWRDEFSRQAFIDRKIWFSSTRDFNDPFDRGIPIRHDLGSHHYKDEMYGKMLRREIPEITDKELEFFLHLARMAKTLESFENQRIVTEDGYARLGVFSLSGTWKSPLLWSHYADSHRGFCIEFRTEETERFLESLKSEQSLIIAGYNMKYINKYPVLMPDESNGNLIPTIEAIIHKHALWSYEEEFRFICMQKTRFGIEFPINIVSRILIGCECHKDVIAEIKSIADVVYPDVPIEQTIRPHHSFDLTLQRIN